MFTVKFNFNEKYIIEEKIDTDLNFSLDVIQIYGKTHFQCNIFDMLKMPIEIKEITLEDKSISFTCEFIGSLCLTGLIYSDLYILLKQLRYLKCNITHRGVTESIIQTIIFDNTDFISDKRTFEEIIKTKKIEMSNSIGLFREQIEHGNNLFKRLNDETFNTTNITES
jgi:hypothetical protein